MKVAVTSKSFSKNAQLVEALEVNFSDIKLNHAENKLSQAETVDFLSDADIAIVALEEINEAVLSQLPNLKAIVKYGVGLDNIDIEACQRRGVHIGWSGGVNKFSVAEMALGFMLMLTRNLYVTSNQLKNYHWNKNGGVSLYNKTIGIIGLGYIGKALVELLKPFHCTILANDIVDVGAYCEQNGIELVSKEVLFERADVVTLNTPLTELTHHMINADVLKCMRSSSLLINTARGDLIHLGALKEALIHGVIAGAALDVYDQEPPTDHELITLENLICTPHILETQERTSWRCE
jgi:D-3-phosphoglycerate dehydrogenase